MEGYCEGGLDDGKMVATVGAFEGLDDGDCCVGLLLGVADGDPEKMGFALGPVGCPEV